MPFLLALDEYLQWLLVSTKEKTVRGYALYLKQFYMHLVGTYGEEFDIRVVQLKDVTNWLNLMKRLNWDANSLIPKAVAVKGFFKYWHLKGYQVVNPEQIPIPAKEYKLPRVANEENYKKLLDIIPKKTNDPRHIRNHALIRMIWDTGARLGEVLSLNVSDLQAGKAIINTEKSKGKRPFREVFWKAETQPYIERWIAKRGCILGKPDTPALFISVTSWKVGERLTIRGAGEMLRRYSDKAGIPNQNAHSFRHRKGHHIINSGGSAADVMNILGHSSLASSSIYTMMTDEELKKRAGKYLDE